LKTLENLVKAFIGEKFGEVHVLKSQNSSKRRWD